MFDRRFGLGLALAVGLAGWGCKEEITQPTGLPQLMTGVRGVSQTGEVGAAVSVRPTVEVVNEDGRPLLGTPVTFAVTGGGGTATGLTVQTDINGRASVGSWVLGPSPGTNTMVARVSGLADVTFTASGSNSKMQIEIRYHEGLPTASQQAAFLSAAARWVSLITGDLPNVLIQTGQACGSNTTAVDETIDDLLIFARVVDIDGPGGVLAQAGPCLVRNSNTLPVVGQMEFDSADLQALESGGTMEQVMVHEMGHVLGFGAVLWSLFTPSLIADASLSGGADPHFTGPQALGDFDAVGGTNYTGNKVPLAEVGGPGSQDSHWRESVFDNELMTPIIATSGSNPLSRVTVGALGDMGYVVDKSGVDPYTLPPTTVRAGPPEPGVHLGDDLMRGPVTIVDPSGRVVGSAILR